LGAALTLGPLGVRAGATLTTRGDWTTIEDMSMPKLTDEQRQAIQSQAGDFPRVEDDQSNKVYVLVDVDLHQRAMQALRQQEDIDAIQAGLDAVASGDVSPLAEVDRRIREELGFPPRQ